MKRIAVIAIAATTFAVGLNVGRYVESVKSAPVINVTVNGVSTNSTDKADNLECSFNDFERNSRDEYNGSFKVSKSVLKSSRYGDTIEGRRVLDIDDYLSGYKIFMDDEKASGGMIIVRCK